MSQYRDKVYAGILGKIVGVYFGRPIEGWSYEKIRNRFGIVDHYVARDVGLPLHVADDDLAGTFTFFNTVEDCPENIRNLTAEEFGTAWLNYIIENKTIFWWGGFGRSTEHTAFLRLKNGVKAPMSGSKALNGAAVAEQIGAQIFIEALAFLCPSDPELARYLVRQSASVSHDGMALEAACFLASMESMAFSERRLDRILAEAKRTSGYDPLIRILEDVCEQTTRIGEFRQIRDWLETHYGYALYPGNCHVVPNFALIIACLLLGGDSFSRALQYCVSSGWDTDCNGGNLCALNAVRLGLDSMKSEYDYLTPIADRFYCISGDVGTGVTDAVLQTNRIIKQYNRLYQKQEPVDTVRFSFSLPGSVQGFSVCPVIPGDTPPPYNQNLISPGDNGMVLTAGDGESAVSAPCMWEPEDKMDSYELIASPVLYETQTIVYSAEPYKGCPEVTPYIIYFDFNDRKQVLKGPKTVLCKPEILSWKIPSLGGLTISRIGFLLHGKKGEQAVIHSLDWSGAPEKLHISGSLYNPDLGHANMQIHSFVSSAKQFSFDRTRTFVISDTDRDAIVVTGTAGWTNYSVSCLINAGLNEQFGLVGRVRGLRRYYGILLNPKGYMRLIRRNGEEENILAERPVIFEPNRDYPLSLSMQGNKISASFHGLCLEAEDDCYVSGGCGFRIDCGTFLVSDFHVQALPPLRQGKE